MKDGKACVCRNCGNGCSDRQEKKRGKLRGALAARPWIWVVLAYLVFVSALTTMVVTAVRHQQPDVLQQQHGR